MARGKRAIDNREVIGSCYISNTGGITITEINIDDNYICFNIVTDRILSSHKRRIDEDKDGRIYFQWGGKWYLDEFLTI